MASNHRTKAQEVFTELTAHYKGDTTVPELFLAGVFSRSKILLEGAHGKGKSMIAELTAAITGASYSRVQGSQGLTESKYLATMDVPQLMQGKQQVIWLPFVDAQIKVFDEWNRAHPSTLNGLFELMAEGCIDYAGERRQVGDYAFIGTMNPADSGTYEVPPPLMDRFDICLPTASVNYGDKVELLLGRINGQTKRAKRVLQDGELEAIWAEVAAVKVSTEQVEKLARVERTLQVCEHGDKEYLQNFPASCENCRFKEGVCSLIGNRWPASERPALSTIQVAKGLAYLRGRNKLANKDIEDVLPYVFYHRLELLGTFQSKQATKAQAIRAVFNKIQKAETERVQALELIAKAEAGKVDVVKATEDLKQWSDNDLVLAEIAEAALKSLGKAVTAFKRKIAQLDVKKLQAMIRNKKVTGEQAELVKEKIADKLQVTVSYDVMCSHWDEFAAVSIRIGKELSRELAGSSYPPQSMSNGSDLSAFRAEGPELHYVFRPESLETQKRVLAALKTADIKTLAVGEEEVAVDGEEGAE